MSKALYPYLYNQARRTVIVRGGHIIRQGAMQRADLKLVGGRIAEIAPSLPAEGDEIIDATGLVVLPGIIDPQVHFRDPGLTWKEDLQTGSQAAAAGGVTSFLEMPNTKPAIVTAALMAEKKKTASEKCVVNWNFFIGATPNNLDELLATPNVCGIKIFMGSSTGDLLVHRDEDLERIFAKGGRLIAVHAEDEATIVANKAAYEAGQLGETKTVHGHNRIRTPEAALKATQKAVSLSQKYRRRLHILHVTSAEEAAFLETAKIGHPITAEVCPQHFVFSTPEIYDRLGTYGQMNPPIREKRHAEALWQALKNGTFDCLATDHAPHTREEKDKGYPASPSGMPGVETLLPAMLDRVNQGLCSLVDIARWMSAGPAAAYGLKGKGHLEVGYDADLTMVDMAKSKTVENGKLFTKVNWSPFAGITLKGWPVRTVVMGETVFVDGAIVPGAKGYELEIDAGWERG
jgi:dihydroorotase